MVWTKKRDIIIGYGSTAAVSLAIDNASMLACAVKSMQVSSSDSLHRERKILRSLNHHRIVRYIGFENSSENNGEVCNLFMEYLSGGSIAEHIRKHGGRLQEPIIRTLTYQIVEGLAHLHSLHLAHCDIKPTNVVIGDGGAKLVDFGCARWIGETGEGRPISGTPRFMSPEAARGEEQGCPADVWAVGCIVIEMVTGRPPWFDVDNPVSTMFKIGFSHESPSVPNFLSSIAKDFLDKCFRRDPRERWTADQLLHHPFLEGIDGDHKQHGKINSTSPTSVLDLKIWDPADESTVTHYGLRSGSMESPADRICRLSEIAGGAGWTMDQEWVTVRSSTDM